SRPVSMSQIRTRRSTPALASVKPSGENATVQMPCECPRNVLTSRAPADQYSRKSMAAVVPADGTEGCAGTVEEALGCVISGTLRIPAVVAAGDDKLDCKSPLLAGIICGPKGDRKRCHGAKSSRSKRRKHRMTTGESGSRNRTIEADMELRFQPALLQEVID